MDTSDLDSVVPKHGSDGLTLNGQEKKDLRWLSVVHQIVLFSLLRAHSKMYTFTELHTQVHMLSLSKKKKNERK